MKPIFTKTIAVALITMVLFSFTAFQSTGIKGTVTPAGSVNKVWAISGTDSLQTLPSEGSFTLNAKAGTYTVLVEAATPYKNFIVEKVVVEEGKITDLGEIKLAQ